MMFEALKIPKIETLKIPKIETLMKFEEISLKEENPLLKTMESENPPPDLSSLEGILCGSVNGGEKTLISSELLGKIENPELKTIEFENPSLDSSKSQEIQPFECGKIMVKEGGENLRDTHISVTLDESLNVENSVLKSENSLSDCVECGKNFCGSVKIEGGECSKTLDAQIGGENLGVDVLKITLDDLGDEKFGGEKLGDDLLEKTLDDLGDEKFGGEKFGDDQFNKTLDDGENFGGEKLDDDVLNKALEECIKDESDDMEDNCDVKVSDSSSEEEYDLTEDSCYRLGLGVPFVGNRSNCGCHRCLREEDEDSWRNFPRQFWRPRYHRTMYRCGDCGCERSMFRDPRMEEIPCPCRDCCCDGERIVVRDHPRRYGRNRNSCDSNMFHPRYCDSERFYGNRHGFSNRVELEPEPEPCLVGAGLANLGNTCFLNSIMQCFTHTVVLVQGLLTLKHDASNHGVGEFCVLCAVRDHIEFSFVKSGRVIAPSNLVDNLSNISSFFQKYQQEDAHEFLQAILDKLDSNWSKYEASANDAADSSSPSDTLVQRTFGGRLVSQICCCKCGHSSDTPEPLLDLSLEIEEADSLESALESFTKVETLDDTNMFKCGGCKELVKAKKQLLLDRTPLVAALHLKRFKNDGIRIEKIDKMVAYPLELDLTPYTKGSNDRNEDLKYELFAFVVHVGFSATSGHYFCYIRTSPNEWYRFDDSKVRRVSEDIALRQDAYILFYTKKGTPWFSTLFDKWKEECSEKILSTSPKSVLNVMDIPSTSNIVESSVHSCDPGAKEDAICENSTAFPCELRQDEIETKVGVGVDIHGSLQRDGSRDASIVPASEPPMQDKIGPLAGVDTWDSSVANTTSTTSLCVSNRSDEVKNDEAELDDTLFIMKESDANKHKTFSKTIDEIGSASSRVFGTPSLVEGNVDCGLESDLGVEPSTPIRDPSPTKVFDGEPAEGAFKIPCNHLKRKHKSSSSAPAKKSPISSGKLDMKRKEAAKLCKSMPGGRGSLFMNYVNPFSKNSLNGKRRKQGSAFHHRQSPKKRVKTSPKQVLRPLAV